MGSRSAALFLAQQECEQIDEFVGLTIVSLSATLTPLTVFPFFSAITKVPKPGTMVRLGSRIDSMI